MYEKIMKLSHFLLDEKVSITFVLFIFTLIFGVTGFCHLGLDFLDSFIKSLKLFTLDIPDKRNIAIIVAQILSLVTIFLGTVLIFTKDYSRQLILKRIVNNASTLIYGLNETTIDHLLEVKNFDDVLIVENDIDHSLVNKYFKGIFLPIVSDFDLNKRLPGKVILSTNSDQQNMNILWLINNSSKIDKVNKIEVYLFIKNLKLVNWLNQNFDHSLHKNINLKPFPYYDEVLCNYFFDYPLTTSKEIIHSNNDVNIVLFVDESEFTLRLIYYICMLSILPNKNTVKIQCINNNIKSLEEILWKTYPELDKITHLKFEFIKLDYNHKSFYDNYLWNNANLESIFLCHKDENINMSVLIDLMEYTYLRNNVYSKIIVAVQKMNNFYEMLNKYQEKYKNVSFLEKNVSVFSEKITTKNKFDNLYSSSIAISFIDKYEPYLLSDLTEQREPKNFFDSDQFKSRVLYMKIILNSIGLDYVPEYKKTQELLKINVDLFYTKLELTKENIEMIKSMGNEIQKTWLHESFSVLYFPSKFDTMFEKLIYLVHERWSVILKLNGWTYSSNRNKNTKNHNFLIPLEHMIEDREKIMIYYDILEFLYIPNILYNVGFLIKEIDN
jgi:hypothetical protein